MKEYELTFQKNIRDLGGMIGYQGKKVKNGRLFRGGFLDKITSDDLPILESFHLTDVVDFRGEEEFLNRPDYRLQGVRYHNFPVIQEHVKKEHIHNEDGNLLWFVENQKNGYEHMVLIYQEMVTSPLSISAYQRFFQILTEDNDRVTYFHCSQGKDRAGLGAFFLEIALGVPLEKAKEDYLHSNKAMGNRVETLINKVKNKDFYNENYCKSLHDVFTAKIDYLEVAIKAIYEVSLDIETYLKDVLKVDINRLREIYLEE